MTKPQTSTHSSTLAWEIPWTKECCTLHPWGHKQSDMTEQLHKWPTLSLSHFTVWVYLFCICIGVYIHYWRRQWQPTPVFLPGESQGRGTWWAAVYGVAQSQTWLKWLSSSSSSSSIHPLQRVFLNSTSQQHELDCHCPPQASASRVQANLLPPGCNSRQVLAYHCLPPPHSPLQDSVKPLWVIQTWSHYFLLCVLWTIMAMNIALLLESCWVFHSPENIYEALQGNAFWEGWRT